MIATGFHRNTPSNFEGGIDFEQYRVEAVVDRVVHHRRRFPGSDASAAPAATTTSSIPISQKEFYQLFAFFNNTDEITSEAERYDFNRPDSGRSDALRKSRGTKAFDAQWSALSNELIAYVRELAARPRSRGDPDRSKGSRTAGARAEPARTAQARAEVSPPRW